MNEILEIIKIKLVELFFIFKVKKNVVIKRKVKDVHGFRSPVNMN